MINPINIDPNIISVVLALGLGAVVGLERETMMQRGGYPGFAGIRTFSFICLMGAIAGILGSLVHIALTVAGFAIMGVLISLAYWAEQKRQRIGLTTEITAMLTFMVGLLAANGQTFLAVISTIAIITVLSLRQYLHRFAKSLLNEEIFAGIKFAIIAFIILPLLPNMTFDPWGALNPYKIWLIVVLISGLSFTGYILNKIMGAKKGMALTGFFGGFVSSTAVNLSLSEQSKESRFPTGALLLALFLAQASSLMLTCIELFVLNRPLFMAAILPLAITIGSLFGLSFFYYRSRQKKKTHLKKEVKMKSPFTLSEALLFGGIFSAMMLTIKILFNYIGDAGLYITSIFSGLISLDAMTVTVAEVAKETPEVVNSVSIDMGLQLLLLGIIASIVQKIIALFFLAGKEFRIKGTLYLIAIIAILGGFLLL